MIPDIIVVAAIILIIGGAMVYIVCSRRRGKKCIGCPYADSCSAKGNSCSCQENNVKEKDKK